MNQGVLYKEATKFGTLPISIDLKIREPGSALTHLCGFMATLVATPSLLQRAHQLGAPASFFACLIFALSALELYAASTLYHTVVAGERMTTIFRKLDHCSISILIAGTYTAICLTALSGKVGNILMAVVWILAAAGIIVKIFWVTCPKWFSSLLYVAMGWTCIFAMPEVVSSLGHDAFFWLLAGGIAYSAGAVIYALKIRKFDQAHPAFGSHEIFHLFIMAGTLCHYILMYGYLSSWG